MREASLESGGGGKPNQRPSTLSTVLTAVDLGYRVIVVADAICSSVDSTHDALMTVYSERFGEQIELIDTDAVLESWER